MSAPQAKWKVVTFWISSILLGLMFIGSGAAKIAGAQMHVEAFASWGIPDVFRPIVGAIEVVAAVLLIVPRTRFWGAGMLVATMIGAALTHIISGVEVPMVGMNVILGGLAALVAWNHRPASMRDPVPSDAAVSA